MPALDKPSILPRYVNGFGCLLRFGWMSFGALLLIIAVFFDITDEYVFSRDDLYYWGAVALVIGLSYLDVAWVNRSFDNRKPERLRDWHRMVLFAFLVFAAIWVLACLIVFLRVGPGHLFP
jgi:hypothetical protein